MSFEMQIKTSVQYLCVLFSGAFESCVCKNLTLSDKPAIKVPVIRSEFEILVENLFSQFLIK
jgi:hypothetical protein